LKQGTLDPSGRRIAAIVGLMTIGFCLAGAPSASAAETHLFDAKLSLTGNCVSEPVDPVPDPLCPGGGHPPSRFTSPSSIGVDAHGNLYVVSAGTVAAGFADARIDIFDSAGIFIDEISDAGAREAVVDSEGHLYVFSEQTTTEAVVRRFDPTVYNPAAGEIEYGTPPVVLLTFSEHEGLFSSNGLAINPSNDHLYVDLRLRVNEYGSAAEGNTLIDNTIGQGVLHNSHYLAVDGRDGTIYVNDTSTADLASPDVVRVFSGAPGHEVEPTVFDGSCTPDGEFSSNAGLLSVAVEEETGHLFADDRDGDGPVYELAQSGGTEECVSTIEHKFEYVNTSSIRVDNGEASPNRGYLFVPSGQSTKGHVYAFEPKQEPKVPKIESESVSDVTEDEAQIEATINPESSATEYRFQIASQEAFETDEFESAATIGEGELAPGNEGVVVQATAAGLAPGTTFHVRVVAENTAGSAEREALFTTFPPAGPPASCPNQALRVGLASGLPDCRAYELVTPPDTGGRAPNAPGNTNAGDLFGTPPASRDGESVSFLTSGGVIPGTEGAGAFNGDSYVAIRDGVTGWHTHLVGPTGTQSSNPFPGGLSPDHGYAVSTATENGTLPLEGQSTRYVRYPDGSFRLVGRGSLGADPAADARLISKGGGHIVFEVTNFGLPAVQLEPDAPPSGTAAVYDRTADEVTHVVSLLPGDLTPAAGEDAEYEGASPDGEGVVFRIGAVLYERLGNAETFEVASGATFAGISEGGDRVFYLKGGDLFAFQAENEGTIRFTTSGDVTVVNVSPDGSRAYFVSPTAIHPGEENPAGDLAQPGEENLYVANGTGNRFVGTLTERDVAGESSGPGGIQFGGLGLWTSALTTAKFALDPSRTTPNGATIIFESRAPLTEYDSRGQAEIYRYDVAGPALECVSCNPTNVPASADAKLESILLTAGGLEPSSAISLIPNLRADGKRVVFESSEALVPSDADGVQDVYEWEAEGTGSCLTPGGCLFLISSGHSARPDYLYGVSESGDDILFSSADLLIGADPDGTQSIYDARVGGGFPEPRRNPCQGEGCRPALSPPPNLPTPAKAAGGGSDNVGRAGRCPKGKHKVKAHGKTRCVRGHPRKAHKRAAKSGEAGK
jgi:hypothetical protein